MAVLHLVWLSILQLAAPALAAEEAQPTATSGVAAEMRPIRQVITLLTEMKAQVTKEAGADEDAWEKYMCWCRKNKKEKTEAVEAAEQRIAELDAFLEGAAAKEASLKTEIEGLGQDIAADQDALATAADVREKEYKAFLDEEADMKETRHLLGEANKVLRKVQLAQRGGAAPSPREAREAAAALVQVRALAQRRPSRFHSVMQRDLFEVLGSLQDAAEGTRRPGQAVEGFLPRRAATALEQNRLLPWEKSDEQLGMEANPNDLEGAAAGAKSYNSRSGRILGILEEMRDEFTRDLGQAQKADFEAEVAFQQLRAAKLAEIAAASKQKAQKEAQLAELLDKAAKAKQEKEETQAAVAADQTFLVNLEENCKTEDEEYKQRHAVRTEEIRALAEALKILNDDLARDLYAKTMDFLQLGAGARAAAEDRAVERSVRRLAEVARRHKSWALASLAVRAQLDDFTKVKAAMDRMLAELQKQQKEEYQKWEFCKAEIDQTEDAITEGQNVKQDLDEKHRALKNEIETLAREIAELEADVKSTEESVKEAGEDRKAENLLYKTSVSDQRATINILHKAEVRLQAFYSASFGQLRAHGRRAPGQPVAPPPPKGKDYEASASAGGVLQLLAKIVRDAEAAEKELEVSEQNQQARYAGFVRDASASLEAARASIRQKEGQKAEAEAAKSETEEAQLSNDEELTKLTDLLKAHHLDCDYLLQFFDVRQKARAEEMDAITEAKAILSGAGFGK